MVKKSLKWTILAYASEPDKSYNYDGDIVEYGGKRYWVSLAEERVEFVGIVPSESKTFAELGTCAAAGIEDGIKDVKEIKETMDFPEGVLVEPEYIINEDGSIKLTGFGLVRR